MSAPWCLACGCNKASHEMHEDYCSRCQRMRIQQREHKRLIEDHKRHLAEANQEGKLDDRVLSALNYLINRIETLEGRRS